MKRFLTLALFALALAAEVNGQDPEFSQFYANPLYLNPAMAGTAAGPRFALNYRNQWPSVSGSFVTYSASYDEHYDGLGGGIGGQVWYDKAGDGSLSTTFISGFYSYQLDIKKQTRDFFIIKLGVQASAFRRGIDFDKLVFGDQIDPRRGIVKPVTDEKLPSSGFYQTSFIPDFSTGILAFSKKFYGGLAVHHIVQPAQSFFGNPESLLPMKLTAHMGLQLPLDNWKRNPETYFSPNLLVQRQGRFTQLNFGAYVNKSFFTAGAWFRHTDPNSDALILLVGFKKDAIKIGYSYDITVSGARAAANGSHEVSLIVELQKYDKSKKKRWRGIVCPKF